MLRHRLIRPLGGAGAALSVLLLLTACGGGAEDPGVATAGTAGTPVAAGTGATAAAPDASPEAYAQCLRDHDVVMTEAIDGAPEIDKVATPIDVVDTAMRACESLRPLEDLSEAPAEEDLQRARDFAACVRDHGVPDWPDPDPSGATDPELDARLKKDPGLPEALRACDHLMQGGASEGIAGG